WRTGLRLHRAEARRAAARSGGCARLHGAAWRHAAEDPAAARAARRAAAQRHRQGAQRSAASAVPKSVTTTITTKGRRTGLQAGWRSPPVLARYACRAACGPPGLEAGATALLRDFGG